MIRIENTDVMGWEHAVRGMRNPKNSWDKSDSDFFYSPDVLGQKDLELAKALASAGTDHGKFLRMIVVYADWTAPLYLWKEVDQYKVGTVTDSCSTMHKIHEKEFDRGDFSYEHIPLGSAAYSDTWDIRTSDMFFPVNVEDGIYFSSEDILDFTIQALNHYRDKYLKTKDKKYWWQMIQLLPSSYNQRRTIMLNYAVLKNMYHARKNHKLDEWHDICRWIEGLPYSELITGEER